MDTAPYIVDSPDQRETFSDGEGENVDMEAVNSPTASSPHLPLNTNNNSNNSSHSVNSFPMRSQSCRPNNYGNNLHPNQNSFDTRSQQFAAPAPSHSHSHVHHPCAFGANTSLHSQISQASHASHSHSHSVSHTQTPCTPHTPHTPLTPFTPNTPHTPQSGLMPPLRTTGSESNLLHTPRSPHSVLSGRSHSSARRRDECFMTLKCLLRGIQCHMKIHVFWGQTTVFDVKQQISQQTANIINDKVDPLYFRLGFGQNLKCFYADDTMFSLVRRHHGMFQGPVAIDEAVVFILHFVDHSGNALDPRQCCVASNRRASSSFGMINFGTVDTSNCSVRSDHSNSRSIGNNCSNIFEGNQPSFGSFGTNGINGTNVCNSSKNGIFGGVGEKQTEQGLQGLQGLQGSGEILSNTMSWTVYESDVDFDTFFLQLFTFLKDEGVVDCWKQFDLLFDKKVETAMHHGRRCGKKLIENKHKLRVALKHWRADTKCDLFIYARLSNVPQKLRAVTRCNGPCQQFVIPVCSYEPVGRVVQRFRDITGHQVKRFFVRNVNVGNAQGRGAVDSQTYRELGMANGSTVDLQY